MRQVCLRLLLLSILFVISTAVRAAISCNITSAGFASAYVPSTATTNVTQSSFTTTCQRNLAGDPTTITYTVRASNGNNPAGNQNRARIGATANLILYDLFQDSGCSVVWRNNAGNQITDTIPVLTGFAPASKTTSYWGCIPGSQVVAAGTYTDQFTMTLRNGATVLVLNAPANVSIVTPASCSISTAPTNMTLAYVALGPIVNASTPIGVLCTNLLPYTMSLGVTNPIFSVANGIRYSLTLSATSATGNGFAQAYSIAASAVAGQAGTCATSTCAAASNVHTLTVSY